MENIKKILERKQIIKKSRLSTPWQVRGSEICRMIDSRRYAAVIKWARLRPGTVERALDFVLDYWRPKSKEGLFFWKLKDLIKRNEIVK